MRTIKFRAWDKEKRRYCDFDDTKPGGCCPYYTGELYSNGDFLILEQTEWEGPERYEIEQFTGLLDKDGKEIYEGDVLKSRYKYGWQISTVMFYKGNFEAKYIKSKPISFSHYTPLGGMQNFHWEKFSKIIGNIHENPELLEGGERQ